MDNKLVVELLLNDIAELTQLTKGLGEINSLPPVLLQLAKHKAENIAKRLDDLTPTDVNAPATAEEADTSHEQRKELNEEQQSVENHEQTVAASEPQNDYDAEEHTKQDNSKEQIETEEPTLPEEQHIAETHEAAHNDEPQQEKEAEPETSESWISRVLHAAQNFRQHGDNGGHIDAEPQELEHEQEQEEIAAAQEQNAFAQEPQPDEPAQISDRAEETSDEEQPAEQISANENIINGNAEPDAFDLFNTQQAATIGTSVNSTTRNEQLNKARIVDIFQGMTLGDRFYYQRTLFDSKGEIMNKTIQALNLTKSLDEAQAYLRSTLHWDFESEDQQNFLAIVARLFA